jgi:hypothetical protein
VTAENADREIAAKGHNAAEPQSNSETANREIREIREKPSFSNAREVFDKMRDSDLV